MIYMLGSNGRDVVHIQSALRDRQFYAGSLDGNFGLMTRKAVIKFQLDTFLNADGIVGSKTWRLLIPRIRQTIPDEISTPNSRDELYKVFGDPLISGFWKSYGGFCETPPELDHVFPYKLSEVNGFWCHRYVIPMFQMVYAMIVKCGLADELKTFDGCFNIRKIRGGSQLSMHSWGIAVDHNASTNRLGTTGDLNRGIINCFIGAGFTWGGSFKRHDPMHFEFTLRGL